MMKNIKIKKMKHGNSELLYPEWYFCLIQPLFYFLGKISLEADLANAATTTSPGRDRGRGRLWVKSPKNGFEWFCNGF